MADDARVTILGVTDDGSATLHYYESEQQGEEISITPAGSDEYATKEAAMDVVNKAREAVAGYAVDIASLNPADAERYEAAIAKVIAMAKNDTPTVGGLHSLLMVAPFLESETQGAILLVPTASGFVDERIPGIVVRSESIPVLPAGTSAETILVTT